MVILHTREGSYDTILKKSKPVCRFYKGLYNFLSFVVKSFVENLMYLGYIFDFNVSKTFTVGLLSMTV